MLADILKKALPEIIDDSQGAFIENRQILDGVLNANELIHMRRKEKKSGLLFKIDMEKAYDCVDWSFVGYLFERMGFGRRWRSWMKACVEDTRYSVLVNGSPSSPISATRGLRQGDPLSPFIFTMIRESLSRLVFKAKDLDIVKGFEVSPRGSVVTHLQFADDTLFFCDPNSSEVLGFRAVLRYFELVSGLRINLGKSTLIGVEVENSRIKDWADLVGCGIGKLPFSYLGLLVGGNPRLKNFWTPVVERIERRLAGCGKKFLSLGGRVTLIKLVLINLPTYFLSLFAIPNGVANKIEKLFRRFLWGDHLEKRRVHLVAWSEVTKAISKDGLGIVHIRLRNEALLCKWGWRFGREPNALWVRVLSAKYGTSDTNKWCLGEEVDKSGLEMLKAWWRVCQGRTEVGNFFKECLRILVDKVTALSFGRTCGWLIDP